MSVEKMDATGRTVDGKKHTASLEHAAKFAHLPGIESTLGPILTGSSAVMEKPGQLNPAFSRWLMGYTAVWDDCAPMAMRLSRKSRPSL